MLRPVPDTPRRAVAYIRVSEEGGRGDDLLSPEIQLTAIKDHCARQGYRLVKVLDPDIDLTGRFWRRRRVEEAIRMIEQHDADVLVVWKVSRVARNRKDWAIAVDRVESVGGLLESATEPMDTTTPTGRLTRGMLAELAVWESDVIGDNWRSVHRNRLDRGLPHYGPPRLGYTYSHDGGYRPGEDAPTVAELYRRYVAGSGVGELVLWLRSEGVKVPKSGSTRWTRYGVQYFLDCGFAAGLLHVHDPTCRCRSKCSNRVHIQGAHEAIIDPALWEAYKTARSKRRGSAARSRTPVSKLAGLVICDGCNRPMQLQGSNRTPRAAYVCRTNRLAAVECPSPAWVRRDRVETLMRDWLAGCAAEIDALIQSLPVESVSQQRRDRVQRRVAELTAALGRLAADRALRELPEAAYAAAREDLLADLATASGELASLEQPGLRALTSVAVGVLDVWDSGTPVEVAATVRQLATVRVSRVPRVVPVWDG